MMKHVERITPIVKLDLKLQYKSQSYLVIEMQKVNNSRDLNVVMPMNNRIEYGDNYSQTSQSLLQYYRDQPHNVTIANS